PPWPFVAVQDRDRASGDAAAMTEKYRPSNGTEGMSFIDAWCDRCKRAAAFPAGTGDSCPIAAGTFGFDVGDPKYPSEWTYDAEGEPICTAFEASDDRG